MFHRVLLSTHLVTFLEVVCCLLEVGDVDERQVEQVKHEPGVVSPSNVNADEGGFLVGVRRLPLDFAQSENTKELTLKIIL